MGICKPKAGCMMAFLATNVVLTGLPLIMFFLFTLTVFTFSLIAALLVGLLVALIFTAFAVGVALLVILPTVFLTTMGASFLFLWGLGGYYIVKWFNEGESPAKPGEAIGDKLNSLTGGRLDFVMNPARSPGSDSTNHTSNGTAKQSGGTSNGGPIGGNVHTTGQAKGHAGTATKATGADNATKKAGNVTSTAATGAGVAKGSVGGATGST
ncbi:MAG: hypothetical protein Q9165_004640 [Trypethelium subeluteriae]